MPCRCSLWSVLLRRVVCVLSMLTAFHLILHSLTCILWSLTFLPTLITSPSAPNYLCCSLYRPCGSFTNLIFTMLKLDDLLIIILVIIIELLFKFFYTTLYSLEIAVTAKNISFFYRYSFSIALGPFIFSRNIYVFYHINLELPYHWCWYNTASIHSPNTWIIIFILQKSQEVNFFYITYLWHTRVATAILIKTMNNTF